MFNRDDEALIAHPELYALLPKRSIKDRLLCLYWDAAWRGSYSWSIFRDNKRFVLRRLRSAFNPRIGSDVLGSEKRVSAAFAEAMLAKAANITPMKGGAICIDGHHAILHVGPKPVVDMWNVDRENTRNWEALVLLAEEFEVVFGNEISVREGL